MKLGSLLSSALVLAGVTLGTGCLTAEDDASLGEATSDLSVWQWQAPADLSPHDTTRQVALAPLGSYLYAVYTDASSSTSTLLKWTRWDGTSWRGESSSIGASSDSRPALAAHGGQLHLVYRPVGETRLVMTTSTSGSTWTAPVTVGRSLGSIVPYNPSLLSHDGKLYLSYCGKSGASTYAMVDRWNGTSWSAFHSILASNTVDTGCNSALMASVPDTGEVELVYNSIGTGYSYVNRQRAVIGRSTVVWYEAETLPMKSMRPLSVVTCGGQTHLVHGGFSSPAEIWWSFREGGDWFADAKVPSQSSSAGAALGCLNGTTTVMVHNDGGTNLKASIFGP